MRFLLMFLLALAACTPRNQAHRAFAPDAVECAGVTRVLGVSNNERRGENAAASGCYLQRHLLPAPETRPNSRPDQGWQTLATQSGAPLADPAGYHLAFVEIGDDGQMLIAGQLPALTQHLAGQKAAGRQNVVVAFVHGWRHDASIGDRDVQKLRTLLGYSRAALNTRCIQEGSYCNAALTGVFVGWRGRSFAEPLLTADGGFSPFALGAFPTVWDRKEKSGQHAGRALQILRGVEGALTLKQGSATADKMLVFGHSFGGNMLANAMEQPMLDAIRRHPMPPQGRDGAQMRPVLGDLVVLINPASESRHWTSMQRALRAKSGMDDPQNWLTAAVDADGTTRVDPDRWRQLAPWRRMFPMDQRPVYISITATDNWLTRNPTRRVAYDAATGALFPLAQKLAGKKGEATRTIGHLRPQYASGQRKVLTGPPVGATHEFSVNQGTGQRASYKLSAQVETSWCDPAAGWLRATRDDQIAQGWSFGDGWDYGLDPDAAASRLTAAENIARGVNPASVQWRHSLNLRGRPNLWSVVPGRAPIWNVRALDTAVREHGEYVNYPLWCAINQLVLDDVVTVRPRDQDLLDDMWMEEAVADYSPPPVNPEATQQ